jgi:hypothetical protein
MIPVAKVPEPAPFDADCRRAGTAWLNDPKNANRRPTDLWSPFRDDLEQGFNELCGYAAMHSPTGGTVDHYISVSTDRSKAYEWDNYRFASGTMNNIKRTKDDQILDPYEVGAGWFEIVLPSLQMLATNVIPAAMRAKADFTLVAMGLRDDERIIRWRRSWFLKYRKGVLTLDGLREVAPLIAEAVVRDATQGIHW